MQTLRDEVEVVLRVDRVNGWLGVVKGCVNEWLRVVLVGG